MNKKFIVANQSEKKEGLFLFFFFEEKKTTNTKSSDGHKHTVSLFLSLPLSLDIY
jgi:hypothetical protein